MDFDLRLAVLGRMESDNPSPFPWNRIGGASRSNSGFDLSPTATSPPPSAAKGMAADEAASAPAADVAAADVAAASKPADKDELFEASEEEPNVAQKKPAAMPKSAAVKGKSKAKVQRKPATCLKRPAASLSSQPEVVASHENESHSQKAAENDEADEEYEEEGIVFGPVPQDVQGPDESEMSQKPASNTLMETTQLSDGEQKASKKPAKRQSIKDDSDPNCATTTATGWKAGRFFVHQGPCHGYFHAISCSRCSSASARTDPSTRNG